MYNISSSPHLRVKLDTRSVMLNVILGLLPVTAAAVFFFRVPAVYIILNCIITAILTEWLVLKMRGVNPLSNTSYGSLKDLSAVVTGLLLALILPPAVKWYAATLGTVFAIAVVKHIFGGLGCNIFNPALMGRLFLMIAYPKMLTTFYEPFSVDVVSKATPLALYKFSSQFVSLKSLFLGNISGSIGETSALCILIGGIYLLLRKIADWRIPLTMFGVVLAVTIIMGTINPLSGSLFFHLLSGGLLLGMFFMATDPATSPVTKLGRYVFGAGCGLIIIIIRYWGGYPEGVMFSILFMNALTPLINRYTKPKRFGER
ncbi:MAG: RnfABCDGE type electron transport complex subunit D [Candidatus Omnitrophica bacterium]|nr:RnfABCDGE type electron transport complex subunit D [Candidatus Omnitrophota bacterium]MDD5080672.1 RnfABCDGE type electron transport complex subunit D [Candidatus Omnitrophota bacterium]MDD5440671.1 RnfABCDGE type electron transport complex subunit D [Candidatus Omnitrophota bacterium]